MAAVGAVSCYDRPLSQIGRIISKTDENGSITTYTYDAVGNVTSVTDESGTVTYEYDHSYRPISRTDENGTTRYEYDACGNIISATDPQGNVIYCEYDAAGNIIQPKQSGFLHLLARLLERQAERWQHIFSILFPVETAYASTNPRANLSERNNKTTTTTVKSGSTTTTTTTKTTVTGKTKTVTQSTPTSTTTTTTKTSGNKTTTTTTKTSGSTTSTSTTTTKTTIFGATKTKTTATTTTPTTSSTTTTKTKTTASGATKTKTTATTTTPTTSSTTTTKTKTTASGATKTTNKTTTTTASSSSTSKTTTKTTTAGVTTTTSKTTTKTTNGSSTSKTTTKEKSTTTAAGNTTSTSKSTNTTTSGGTTTSTTTKSATANGQTTAKTTTTNKSVGDIQALGSGNSSKTTTTSKTTTPAATSKTATSSGSAVPTPAVAAPKGTPMGGCGVNIHAFGAGDYSVGGYVPIDGVKTKQVVVDIPIIGDWIDEHIDPNDITQAWFALNYPDAALKIGQYHNGGTNISSDATHFAGNIGLIDIKGQSEGTPINAMRHTIWVASIANQFGTEVSLYAANSHETDPHALDKVSDPYTCFFAGTDEGLQEADNIIDLLNNEIAREINATLPKPSSMREVTKAALDYYHENGLNVAVKNKDGTWRIEVQKLDDTSYNKSVKKLATLDENGFSPTDKNYSGD